MKRYALSAVLAGLALSAACNNDVAGLGPPSNPARDTFAPSLGVDISEMTKLPNGVYFKDIVVGPSTADSVYSKSAAVKVNYAGYLTNGTLFDRSVGATLELANLIVGFRTGMIGMKVGGKRKIVIPSELGYGGQNIKNPDNTIKIPRQSTLVFDVELLSVTQVSTES